MSRTSVDWSDHVLTTSKEGDTLIHTIKKPDTVWDMVTFINTNNIMVVTGDYSNWMFCREFPPSPAGRVSEGNWIEKLQIGSTQVSDDYDAETTQKFIKEHLFELIDDHGYEWESSLNSEELINGLLAQRWADDFIEDSFDEIDDQLEKYLLYYAECYRQSDDEYDYIIAMREYPGDHEDIIMGKKTKHHLLVVFDAFEEICRRLGEEDGN